LDTREYECITEDGVSERYRANVIAEIIYSQCDTEGHTFLVLQEIADHKSDLLAIPIGNGFDVSHNGNRTPKKTKRGWQLLCNWKDGSLDWVALKDLKDSNPIELAEYAVANRIQEERVDDILIISHEPKVHLTKLNQFYEFNLASVGTPERYLGTNIDRCTIPNDATGAEYWSMSSHSYVKNAVQNVKLLLNEEGCGLKSTAKTPFTTPY
jgi:hypothetical protein